MSKSRPFRFGVSVHGSKSRAEWRDIARQAEAFGYSTMLLPDHLGDQLSPIPALVAAADATSTLRVGSLVFDNDFRHPAFEKPNHRRTRSLSFVSLVRNFSRQRFEQNCV